MSEAVGLALDYYFNSGSRGDREAAIAHAVSMTKADADAVARAFDEARGSMPGAAPLPVDPAARGMSDALAAAVNLALEYIIGSPLDREGAVAHAVSATGVDAGAVADALNRVLNNPVGFPNLNTETAVEAANAVAEATALASAVGRADDDEAARRAAAEASGEQGANGTIAPPTPPPYTPPPPSSVYDSWNDHEWLAEPKPWWRESEPYDCDPAPNPEFAVDGGGDGGLGGSRPAVADTVVRERELCAIWAYGIRGMHVYEQGAGAHAFGHTGGPDVLLVGQAGDSSGHCEGACERWGTGRMTTARG